MQITSDLYYSLFIVHFSLFIYIRIVQESQSSSPYLDA